MVGNYLVPYGVCSSSSLLLKRLVASYQNPIIRSVQTGRDKHGEKVFGQERAASTAEEFLKIAEEKADQGIGRHTPDKAEDHVVEEVLAGDTGDDIDAAKERLKPGVEEGSFRKTPSDDL